jgi:uncharacterized protein (TIGR02271 family)
VAEDRETNFPDGTRIETLPDGSLSIPVYAEELLVGKRQVVRERLVVRKRIEIREELIEDEVAFEHLEIEAPEGLLEGDVGIDLVSLGTAPVDPPADAAEPPGGAELVRREERLLVGSRVREIGRLRARKRVETRELRQSVPLAMEHVDIERLPPNQDDSAQVETLADGSVSIPILAEEAVVSRRTVLRERVRIQKLQETDRYRIEETLRREKVEVEREEPG